MALKTMIAELQEARGAYDKTLAKIGDDTKQLVADAMSPLIPPGWAVYWTQYTPYFSDGDACHFSVCDVYLVPDDEKIRKSSQAEDVGFSISDAISLYGAPDEAKSYERDDYTKPQLPKQPGDDAWRRRYPQVTHHYTIKGFPAIAGYEVAKLTELQEVWCSLPKELMERAFGDHAQVMIRPDGTVEVNEYSHD